MCRTIAAWILTVALLSACRSESLRERTGALVLVTTGPEGTELLDREVTVDFGALVIGKSATRSVVLKNLGAGSLVVDRISPSPEASMEAFRVGLDREVVLGPAEELKVEVSFTPPDSDRMAQDYLAVLSVHAENAADGEEQHVTASDSTAPLAAPSASRIRDDMTRLVLGDLRGPLAGDEAEELRERPSMRYILGTLAPQQEPLPQDQDEDLSGLDEDDDAEQGPAEAAEAARPVLLPSSMGLSFAVDRACAAIVVDPRILARLTAR